VRDVRGECIHSLQENNGHWGSEAVYVSERGERVIRFKASLSDPEDPESDRVWAVDTHQLWTPGTGDLLALEDDANSSSHASYTVWTLTDCQGSVRSEFAFYDGEAHDGAREYDTFGKPLTTTAKREAGSDLEYVLWFTGGGALRRPAAGVSLLCTRCYHSPYGSASTN